MPRYPTVAPHRPIAEWARRDRPAHDPVERPHWHLLWLVAEGRRVAEVAAVVGDSADWVRTIIRRYNADGAAGIYAWVAVDAFVRPTPGHSWWVILPTVSLDAMTAALAAFAAADGLDAEHRAVLVVDGAGWHRSAKLVGPEGIDLIPLPPASPELQPVARVWPSRDEPVVKRTVADLDALETVLVTRCQTLRADRKTIKAHTRFHWWPRERRRRITR